MRNLALVCAGLAVFSSVVSVILWRDLRAERELSAGLRTELAQVQTRAPVPATLPPVASPPAAVAASDKPESAAREPAQPAANPVQRVLNVLTNERDMLKDPEYRKARLAQLRLTIPQNYPDLAAELGLSPEQADRLFDLLAENQLEMSSNAGPLIVGTNGQIDQAQLQETMRVRQQLQGKQDAALASQLGDAGFAKWQQYQQTQPARLRVTQLGRTLESAGQPLTEAQMRPLTEAMVAEQARQRQDMQAMVRALGPNPNSADPQFQIRLQEEQLKQQTESNRRLLEAAAPHLNARQLETLRASLDQQMTMSRITTRVMREAEARNQQAAPTGP